MELEDGIDGLVHISDMSWTRRINHPCEVLKKGQQVDVKVLSIDKDKRRISLGLKQVGEDPWPQLLDAIRSTPTCTAVVVQGDRPRRRSCWSTASSRASFPSAQLGLDNVKHPGEHFLEGDELDVPGDAGSTWPTTAWSSRSRPGSASRTRRRSRRSSRSTAAKRATVTETDESTVDPTLEDVPDEDVE